VQGDANRGGAPGGIRAFAPLARSPELTAWRARAQRIGPYLVGGAMFAIAVWVLRGALRRYGIEDLHAELVALTVHQLALAISFTALSFMALIGYEWSALGLVGKRMPFDHLALASFTTQSIAHSTGFAFVIGATLRYHFYSDRGLGIADVAKVQMYFTATFTLGVATLAGAVVLIEPGRLAMATGLPPTLWRVGAATALTLVSAYVVWGGFFHRPLRWRGRELVLPSAGATLIQIFFGVADLIAVAAALYVLLPAHLGLGYIEVLAIFMASIVIGLISHVPGSLGVFESAVVLLVQPTEAETLPLIGALLAFRAIYYLLPLLCGVVLLAVSELHRWRAALAGFTDRVRLDLGPTTPKLVALLVGMGGFALVVAALWFDQASSSRALTRVGHLGELAGGLALLLFAAGLWQKLSGAWRWALASLGLAVAAALVAGAPAVLGVYLVASAMLLFACRARFRDPGTGTAWPASGWVLLLALTLASSLWYIGRG
jgi:uncharacterized membrane protein YbhN (UPF0104 family)